METKKSHIVRGTVCRSSWMQFLKEITRLDEETRLINGTPVRSQTHTRCLFRWEKEGATPVWWKADEFLCAYDLNWTDFEIWCFVEGQNLWEKDPPENYS